MDIKQPMRSYVDLDSVTFLCPCGQSVSGEGDRITEFINKHRSHTNGRHIEVITDDGARCLVSKPEPREIPL